MLNVILFQKYPKLNSHACIKLLSLILFQKMSCSQDYNYLGHHCKPAKLQVLSNDVIPYLNSTLTYQSAPENHPITPEQMQQAGSPTEGKITLFHWQIQRETQRVGEVFPEMLDMQDADGDTYVLMKEVINVENR